MVSRQSSISVCFLSAAPSAVFVCPTFETADARHCMCLISEEMAKVSWGREGGKGMKAIKVLAPDTSAAIQVSNWKEIRMEKSEVKQEWALQKKKKKLRGAQLFFLQEGE